VSLWRAAATSVGGVSDLLLPLELHRNDEDEHLPRTSCRSPILNRTTDKLGGMGLERGEEVLLSADWPKEESYGQNSPWGAAALLLTDASEYGVGERTLWSSTRAMARRSVGVAGEASDKASRSARGGWEARRQWKATSATERLVLEDDVRVDNRLSNAAGSPPAAWRPRPGPQRTPSDWG
jgi:hypothetical protein